MPVILEGPELDALKARAKKQLRNRARAVRAAMPRSALKLRSDSIASRIDALPELASARSVALFWPMEGRGEVDLRETFARCRARGLRVYYPVSGETWQAGGFSQVDAEDALEERGRGFLEPPPEAPRASASDIDVIVVPALGVSSSGHRLGYGAGFYDAILPRFRPPAFAVVVAYDFEMLAEVPVLPHDVACDAVVTDSRVLRIGMD
jgi:5-formyltetrahydrofolate cyclo-ligase